MEEDREEGKMKTGEHYSLRTMAPRMAEVQQEIDYVTQQLRYDINAKIGDVLKAHEGKEVVVLVETIDLPPHLSPYLYLNEFEHKIEYQMKLTALLLNWQDAEIGDCIHVTGFNVSLAGRLADAGINKSFVWEGKWWRRVE